MKNSISVCAQNVTIKFDETTDSEENYKFSRIQHTGN